MWNSDTFGHMLKELYGIIIHYCCYLVMIYT